MKYLKFLETIKDRNLIIWKKNKEYKVTFENDELYHAKSEIKSEICGIEKKCEGKRFIIIEKDGENNSIQEILKIQS